MKPSVFYLFSILNFKVVLSMALLCFGLANAQLYIAEDYDFSTNGDLTTKEVHNYFNTNVVGDGKLYFNQSQKQDIYTKNGISLPDVFIDNVGEFYNHTELIIKGNLSIANSNAYVLHNIYVENKLLNIDRSHIKGIDLIIEKYLQQKLNDSNSIVLVHQNLLSFMVSVDLVENDRLYNIDEYTDFTFYKNKFFNQHRLITPTPPPKQIQNT